MAKKFEIPYNFCKEAIVGIAYKYKDKIDTIYIPAFYRHTRVTRIEIDNYPKTEDEYIDHINFLQGLGFDVSILFQGGVVDKSIVDFYLGNNIKSFIVYDDALAIMIKELCPEAKITASITKQLSPMDIKTMDLSMYDRIVLDFRLNDIDIIKDLPKKYKYVLMPNTPCYMDCPKERCQKHWFDGFEFQKGKFCHELGFCKPAWIDAKDLSVYDDYVELYKLQGREICDYSLLYYMMHYMDEYYASEDIKPFYWKDEFKYDNN